MAKRASTQESLHIAFEILRHIPKTGQVTASEIHQKLFSLGLQRDLRTIQRTLDMLSQHFDIERDERVKPYGYRWSKHSNGFQTTWPIYYRLI